MAAISVRGDPHQSLEAARITPQFYICHGGMAMSEVIHYPSPNGVAKVEVFSWHESYWLTRPHIEDAIRTFFLIAWNDGPSRCFK